MALLMAAGALLGGYPGGSMVRFVNRTVVRLGIVTLGIAIAAYDFFENFRRWHSSPERRLKGDE